MYEAQAVVAEADSLWRNGQMYGMDEGDSATLAEAYETLKKPSAFSYQLAGFRSPLSDTYAHACYHYGRLLRKKDNPVEAMQAFISATHTRTRDYHILGRVYSNMGSICHLASEYSLSYDMYEKSAEMFLKNGDTINYYYALNDMAFELAEQGKKEETISFINYFSKECEDSILLTLGRLTKARLYNNLEQYDSVLYTLNTPTLCLSAAYVLKAQAFWNIGKVDSALFYAKRVLDSPSSLVQDKYNLYYILLNGDTTLSNSEIIEISALRSDIETDILTPLHNQWAIAVQLLKSDLNKTTSIIWLYIVLIMTCIGIIVSIHVLKKHRQHKFLYQQMNELEYQTIQKKQHHEQLLQKHKQYTINKLNQLEKNCDIFRTSQHIKEDLHWHDYGQMCKVVDDNFYMLTNKLRQKNVLNETEIRLCVLVLLGLKRVQIAEILPYALNSIGKLKDHTAKSLGTTGKKLRFFLLQIAVD